MREKLQTFSLAELKEMAKSQGLKGISTLRKTEIIDLLCQAAEKEEQARETAARTEAPARESRPQEQSAVQEQGRSQEQNRPQEQHRTQENRGQENRVQESRQEYRPRQEGRPDQRRNTGRPYENRFTQNRGRQDRNNNFYSSSQNTAPQSPAPSQTSSSSTGEGERIIRMEAKNDAIGLSNQDMAELDSGLAANGILEVMPDGFGFIRCENFLPGEDDVYVAPSQIRRFNLKTGDIITGNRRVQAPTEKFAALLYIKTVNGYPLSHTETRPNFEDLTPIFPNERLHMEGGRDKTAVAMRVLDLLAPIGKGQRGMIVSPPKAGKTTLLKQVAKAITTNHPEMHLMILLIDERPEEVTDIKEAIAGPNVEVIYSTFDELPERHKRVSEMVIERAKRLVEHGRDVIILLDSITRLARAYNLTVPPSGRTLSGGLDPAALHMPKRFFGAARNMREGGSLTILATALVETGSKMDDVVYEEFKGTGNMELILDRKLQERRVFPAVDIIRSGTRREDLLLTPDEQEAVYNMRRALNGLKSDEAAENILNMFAKTRNNGELVQLLKKQKIV